MFAVAIFISYALHCYVPVEVVWRGYLLPRLQRSGSRHLRLAEYALRIGLCLLTCECSLYISYRLHYRER